MILFPAIDLKDGQCVRLKLGDMATRRPSTMTDPGAQAKAFEEQGFEWLHVVDLNGAFEGQSVNGAAVDAILKATKNPVQLGGGIRTLDHIEDWLRSRSGPRHSRHRGGARSGAGEARPAGCFPARSPSASTPRAARWRSRAGPRPPSSASSNWRKKFEGAGVAAIIYTDIDRDGVLTGINWASTLELADAVSIPVIASGGLASMADIVPHDRCPTPQKLEGAISGRALYDGRIDPAEALAVLPKAAEERTRMTLKARVIPCLDVKDGRVVKGVNFVDLIDAGDPVEAAQAYDAAGADELCFLDITASSDNRDTIFDVVARTAEHCFMPLTVGGGVAPGRRYPQAAAGRRRQGVDQHGGGEQSRFRRRGGRQVRQPVHRRRHRRQEGFRAPARPTAGRSSPMAAAARPASTRWNSRRRWSSAAPARSC